MPQPKHQLQPQLKPQSPPQPPAPPRPQLPKAPTGIQGLDEITGGGLPKGRSTLVCGGTGCGKTLLAMEFLVRGARQFNEPGVFMTFEESPQNLVENVASLGFDLGALIEDKKIVLEVITLERREIEVTGAFDLEGLFIRLGQAIDAIGAKRVALDAIDALFVGLSSPLILRAELRRLFHWLMDKGVSAIITAEQGDKTLTREGLEEYVSDCVIVLDHRVQGQNSARHLRVVKYRGSTHGANEYPFLIDQDGFSVTPVTSLGLQHRVTNERVSSGIARLDAMLGGAGYFRGASVLASGTAGTGKSSLAAHFCDAACRRGERALYFAFDESPSQIQRNMHSIGLELGHWVEQGLLCFQANRPTFAGLEMQLLLMHKAVLAFKPQVVVVDPLNSFLVGNSQIDVRTLVVRLLDFLKTSQITSFSTTTTSANEPVEVTEVAASSMIDTWLILRHPESAGERNRTLSILKSRGMAHSNQIREFLLTGSGLELCDVPVGASGGLTGSARLALEAREQAASVMRQQKLQSRQHELESRRRALEAQIEAMRAEFAVFESQALNTIEQEQGQASQQTQQRTEMGLSRSADLTASQSAST